MDDTWSVVYDRFDEYRRHTTIVPCPGPELYARLSDKRYLTKRAGECGVPTPRSYLPASYEEAAALCDRLAYPVLLKPPRSTTGAGIRQVHDADQFVRALKEAAVVPLIQECVPGEDLDLSVLCVDGEVLAHCAYEMVRNYPMPYGPPIASRTIPDEGMLEPARRLLHTVGYHGPANLDFRRDARDGVPRLLDFNARLAGTNEIAMRSGVDFAHMLYRLALGHDVDPVTTYRIGLEFRWLMFGEVRHFFQTERKAETARALTRWRGVTSNVSLADPLPHGAHCLDASIALVRALLGRRGRG
jgi:predicted ATP-grasp superfamily ATP-dependent carboligase